MGERFPVHSAGTRPKGVHPMTHRVLAELGVDSSAQSSKSVRDFLGKEPVGVAIVLCDEAAKECPSVYPFAAETLYWPFDDPALEGLDEAAQLARFRRVRDEIEARLREWIEADGTTA